MASLVFLLYLGDHALVHCLSCGEYGPNQDKEVAMTKLALARLACIVVALVLATSACSKGGPTEPPINEGPLEAAFTMPKDNGLKYEFVDRSTAPSADPIVGWHWNFGDGATSAEQNPVHIYDWDYCTLETGVGYCTVVLTVTTRSGKTASADTRVIPRPLWRVMRPLDMSSNGAFGNIAGFCPAPVNQAGKIQVEVTVEPEVPLVIYTNLREDLSKATCDNLGRCSPEVNGSILTEGQKNVSVTWPVGPGQHCVTFGYGMLPPRPAMQAKGSINWIWAFNP